MGFNSGFKGLNIPIRLPLWIMLSDTAVHWAPVSATCLC